MEHRAGTQRSRVLCHFPTRMARSRPSDGFLLGISTCGLWGAGGDTVSPHEHHFVYSTGGSVTRDQTLEKKVRGQCQLVRRSCLKEWGELRKPVKTRWQAPNAMSFSNMNIRQNGALGAGRRPKGRGRGLPLLCGLCLALLRMVRRHFSLMFMCLLTELFSPLERCSFWTF